MNNNIYNKKTNNPKKVKNYNNRFRNWRNQQPAMMSKLINKKKSFKRKIRN